MLRLARTLRGHGFAAAYSVHRSARTALLLFFARIPCRIGFAQSKLSVIGGPLMKTLSCTIVLALLPAVVAAAVALLE